MASAKTTIFFILAAVFIASASAAAGSFCADAEDPALCKQLTGGAKTWGAAMSNALNAVLARVNAGKSTVDVIAAKLPRSLKPPTKQSIVSTCRENLSNIIDELNKCLGFVKSDPTSALSFHLSSITFSDCTDGLEEFGFSVPEATHYADLILSLDSALLTIAKAKN